MSSSYQSTAEQSWKPYEKGLFRFLFVYFVLQAFPLDWKYYARLFQIDWFHIHFQDIFNISRYTPQLLGTNQSADFWGIQSFADWGALALIALVGAIIWSARDKKREDYDQLYYVLRVVLRYRLALGIIAYGFLKLFPLQSPPPSISELNTNYGDLSAWKLFSLSLGVAPSFESFLGLVEILAGLLLLYRKTVFVGAFIVLCFTGNVFLSNLAYEGGEGVYSLYLIQFAAFLLAYDARRLFTLLSLEKPSVPNTFKPQYTQSWQPRLRVALKSVFILFFVIIYGAKTYQAHKQEPYQYPTETGWAAAAGLYDVARFVYNGKEIPYSKTDPNRWQNVVIEKWPTLSIETAKQATVVGTDVEIIHPRSEDRDYEYAGTTGRHYYRYHLDPAARTLALKGLPEQGREEQWLLRVNQPNADSIVLQGTSVQGNAIEVVLQKVDKKYLLEEARKASRRSRLVL